ncbi:MAG: thermonuclease family protein [Patescibacteria group bacterium]
MSSILPITSRQINKLVATVAVFVVLSFLGWIMDTPEQSAPSVAPQAVAGERVTSTPAVVTVVVTTTNAVVTKVVDGDTLEARMDGSEETVKVRLLGVNTPETVDPRRPVECFGKEASAYAKSLLTDKRIRLEADPQADDLDKYQRLLRNVILEDGTDFNAALVREGYAYAYLSFPQNKQRKAELRRLEAAAKEGKRGLWNPETCAGAK